jgi:predicted GNAT family N-acyltransferase
LVDHLFVAPEHQRLGIAGCLWQEAKFQAMKAAAPSQFTVNSSRLGVPVYRACGFEPVGEEVSQHGVTVVPMRLEMQE